MLTINYLEFSHPEQWGEIKLLVEKVVIFGPNLQGSYVSLVGSSVETYKD